MGQITVHVTGQTLVITAPENIQGTTVPAFAAASMAAETELTFPLTITADQVMHVVDGPVTFEVTQPDGDVLWSGQIHAVTGIPRLIRPLPVDAQVREDITEVATTAGAAYVLPAGGITADDLSDDVTASLGLADTAYQLPGTGIPASDMATAVQTALTDAGTAVQPGDLGGAALLDVGTTTGTVCAGDDSRVVAGGTAVQPGDLGGSATLDVGTTTGTVAAGDHGHDALTALVATAVTLTVDDASITTAEISTFTAAVAPQHVTGACGGTIQLMDGAAALGEPEALVSGTVDIPVLGSAMGEGVSSVTAVYAPGVGQPWTTSTSTAVEVTVSGA